MFTSLGIENFKAIGSFQKISVRPITLLFGANSSGKSSVLQSLLLLKQTLEEAEDRNSALLPRGGLVDLGGFEELVFRHDKDRAVRFSLGVRPQHSALAGTLNRPLPVDEAETILSFSARSDGTVELIDFELSSADFGCLLKCKPIEHTPKPQAEEFEEFPIPGRWSQTMLRPSFISNSSELYISEWEHLDSEMDDLRAALKEERARFAAHASTIERILSEGQQASRVRYTGGRARVELQHSKDSLQSISRVLSRLEHYSLEDFCADLVDYQKKFLLRVLNFIPAALRKPSEPRHPIEWLTRSIWADERHGQFTRRQGSSPIIGLALQHGRAIRDLLSQTVYLGPLREHPSRHYIFSGNLPSNVGKSGKRMPDLLFKNPELVRAVNEWLNRFGADCEINVSTVKDPHIRDVFGVRLVDRSTGVSVSSLDVGFGISQMLPILVQGMLSSDQILLIEQPEIHLHPRLQAEFGSFLAESISKNRNNQFIIETHSEHLLLRIQRLIRNGELSSEDVSVVYATKTNEGSTLTELRLDREGEFIDRWPDGFFEEGFIERFSE